MDSLKMESLYLGIVLAPLIGAVLSGIFGHWMERRVSHIVTIGGVAISFVLALIIFKDTVIDGNNTFNENIHLAG